MKKKLLALLIVVAVLTGVTCVTAAVINKPVSAKPVPGNTNIKTTESNIYEVVDFVPPTKTVYSLSEVYTIDISTEPGEVKFVQNLDFDGTGMSMTVKNKNTGETSTYDYTCDHFNLEGEHIKCEGALSFYFNPGVNTVLTEGEHTTEVMLITDDGECVMHETTFYLVDDSEKDTQSDTESEKNTDGKNQDIKIKTPESTQKNEPQKPVSDKDDAKEETDEQLVLPPLHSIWVHYNNPHGCTIEITNQNGNTLDFTICSTNVNATKIATADVTVTLNEVYKDGDIIRGNGTFEYTDSFSNSGTGTLNISENAIILVINEEYNAGRGFGISNNTGKYL